MFDTDNESISEQIKRVRKYIKLKILEDNTSFRNHDEERKHVYDLITRVIMHGESHSALIIGPRGCGKTTLLNSVLHQVSQEADVQNDALIIKLNGLIHGDEKIALKSITAQMQLENAVGDHIFGTFAENLSFLLSCLKTGSDRTCKSMIFILEEFDLFCHSGRTQTLLYNLFDITHSKQAPMCVLGVTNRMDVMELLEKRVKSRFSHRHIFMFPNECSDPLTSCKRLFVDTMSLPTSLGKRRKDKRKRKKSESIQGDIQTDGYAVPIEVVKRCSMELTDFEIDSTFIEEWNAHIQELAENDKFSDVLEKFSYYTVNEQIYRNVLYQIISKLSPAKPYIDVSDVSSCVDGTVSPEHSVKLLQSLSILELSLVIAMMHAMEIFDGQPMNFEMVLHRYSKFANTHSSAQAVPRPVILKAFEHLHQLEIIVPIRTDGAGDASTSRVQKEYKLYTLGIPVEDIKEAVKGFKALPTEISHWFNSSVM
ncbi:origin recognition complex subunit 4 isoform X2 [Danaus plexippus]|uniref:origin recognition complex subunit 4 isoform X2 n=1 Tax=Danaus plexippus TaxID=13037 RepID=UPI002AB1577B|nr:origin recognition complex subunit 4 isoform X2 [Danaus plexippus]